MAQHMTSSMHLSVATAIRRRAGDLPSEDPRFIAVRLGVGLAPRMRAHERTSAGCAVFEQGDARMRARSIYREIARACLLRAGIRHADGDVEAIGYLLARAPAIETGASGVWRAVGAA